MADNVIYEFDDDDNGGLTSEVESSEIPAEIARVEASVVDSKLDSFNEAEQDPFAPVRVLAKSNLTGASLIQENYYKGSSVSEYYGRRLEASASTYNSLSKSRINEKYQTVTKPLMPSGLVARPTDKDYLRVTNKLLDAPGTSMKGVYFQMQEKSVVSALLEARGSVDLLMDGVGLNSDATAIGVTGKNKIVKEAFVAREVNREKRVKELYGRSLLAGKVGIEDRLTGSALKMLASPLEPLITHGVKKSATVHMEEGYLHPKMAYFTGADNKITGFMFGTQNITETLPKNNTVEEALFITGKVKDRTTGELVDAADGYIGQQIKTAVDVIQQAASQKDTFASDRAFRNTIRSRINKELGKDKNLFVNQGIQAKMQSRIQESVRGTGKVILNIQYLETIFKSGGAEATDGFGKYRKSMLESMQTLASQGRLSLITSDTSVSKSQGLFSLLTHMSKLDGKALTGTDKLAYDTFQTLVKAGAFKTQPVQYMHSKTAAFLEKDEATGNYSVQDVFITTANYSRNAFERNVEMGLFLTKSDREALGIGAGTDEEKRLNSYFVKELDNKLNKGLFVERMGKEDQVLNTIRRLESIGGVETYDDNVEKQNKDARFTFNRKFVREGSPDNYSYRLVGLDIKLKDKQTMSVTIGSTFRYTQNRTTGKMEGKEMPVIYLNKGNRIITGAAYKYSGSKQLVVKGFDEDGSDVVLRPGDSMRLDANQVLASYIETLEKSYAFERNQRSLLLALNYLDKKHGLVEAIQYIKGKDADDTFKQQHRAFTKLTQLVLDQDLTGVGQNAYQIRKLISVVPDVDAFYQRTIKETKKLIASQIVDPLPQPHELPYSSIQVIENTSLFGADTSNMELLYNHYASADSVEVKGLILSQISLRHEDELKLEGRHAVRGVAAISRPQSLSELEMHGGLHKARESAPKVLNANFMNATQGLRAITAREYRDEFDARFGSLEKRRVIAESERTKLTTKVNKSDIARKLLTGSILRLNIRPSGGLLMPMLLKDAGETLTHKEHDDINKLTTEQLYTQVKERYVSQMFRLYQERDLSKNEREDSLGVKDDAVIYFFPYPKTEQVSQRLKNLLSVRPFAYGSEDFRAYVTSFGGTKQFSDLSTDGSVANLVRSNLLSGLPSAQFAEFQRRLGKDYNDLTDKEKADKFKAVLDSFREGLLNVDDPNQGFIGEEQRFLVSMGNAALSDFSYINAEINRDRGFIFGHRTQTPINFAELQMSQSAFNSLLEDRLKPGTLFVAKDVDLQKPSPGTQRFSKFIKDELGKERQRLNPAEKRRIAGLTVTEANSLLKSLSATKEDDAGNKTLGKEWAKHIKVVGKDGEINFYLKAGVYQAEGTFDQGYDLHRVGQVKDSGSSFSIEGVVTSRRANVSDKLQTMSVKAPAMSRREEDSISVITDIAIGTVDGQPGMATLNIQFVNEMSIVGGLRGSSVKGPMSLMKGGFFETIYEMFESSSGAELRMDKKTNKFSRADLFGIIGAGQMKGFIFNAGNAMLRDKEQSKVYKLVTGEAVGHDKQKAGLKVAEALALTMMGDANVRSALISYYGREDTKDRQQVLTALRLMEKGADINKQTQTDRGLKKQDWETAIYPTPKSLVKDKGHQTVGDAYTSTVAIYTGLVGLISPEHVTEGAAKGLKQTIIDALAGGTKAQDLQTAAQSLLDDTFVNQAQTAIVEIDGKYVEQSIANETTGRSASLLAFFLKAANDLLYDVNPERRFGKDGVNEKAITEFGYVNYKKLLTSDEGRAAVKELVKSTLDSYLKVNEVYAQDADGNDKLLTQASDVDAYKTFADDAALTFETFDKFRRDLISKGFFKTITGTDGVKRNAHLFMSTSEAFRDDLDIQHRYLAAAQAQGVTLNKPKTSLEGHIEAQALEDLDLILYQIYATGQANRYIEIEADPGPGRIMPAAGMQDQTELEGHYASKLSKSQLDLYTSSIKDINAYANIQQTVLTLGAIVEENYGYLGEGRSRSMKRLARVNILELGQDDPNYRINVLDDDKLTKEQIESNQNRIAATKLTLMFSDAFNKTLEKGLPRLLSDKEVEGSKGIVSIAPTETLVDTFFKAYSGDTGKDAVTAQVEYMKHLKQATSELTKDLEDDVRVDYLIDNYISKLAGADKDNPIRTQAEQLVSDLVALQGMYNVIHGKGENGQSLADTKQQLKEAIAELGDNPDNAKKDAVREKIGNILEGTGQIRKDKNGYISVTSGQPVNILKLADTVIKHKDTETAFDELRSQNKDAVKKSLAGKGAEERKRLLQYALAKEYSDVKVQQAGSSSNQTAGDAAKTIVEREVIGEVVKSLVDQSVKEINAPVAAASAEPLNNTQLMFELVKSIIGKNFRDKIQSSLSLDPGKEYLEGRQKLRSIAQTNRLSSKVQKERDFYGHVEQTVGTTQLFEIPMLKIGDDSRRDDGYYDVGVGGVTSEIGLVLGLDVLERVALIFPDFSSEAINAQYGLVNALSRAMEEGVIEKLTRSVIDPNVQTVKLSAAEVEVYNNLRDAAILSNKTAIDLINNQKTMRNAMGEQLNMVGASYIGVSSFLLNANELATGTRFDNLLDVGNAGLKTLLDTLYQKVNSSKTSANAKEIAATQILHVGSALMGVAPEGIREGSTATQIVLERLQSVDGRSGSEKVLAMYNTIDSSIGLDVRSLERKLYATNILTGRQGAPAGSGADFAGGRIGTTISHLVLRADEVNSAFKLDVEGNKTALVLSTLGTQFTELGDYDGDSFQAAITRMAETTAEMKKGWDELDAIRIKIDSITSKLAVEGTPAQQKKAESTNEVIDSITKQLNADLAYAERRADELSKNLASKVQALADLHKQSKEVGLKKIRNYAEQFLGLPAEIFNDGYTDKEGNSWAINAVEDREIGMLFKQTRDTISGFYDNRGFNQGWLADYLTKVDRVVVRTQQEKEAAPLDSSIYRFNLKAIDDEKPLNDYEQNKANEKRKLLSAFIEEYNVHAAPDDSNWSKLTFGASGEIKQEDKMNLINFVASLSQSVTGMESLNKVAQKALGSHLTPDTLREIQAIIGSTGTGLLGQTYNTIIPLITMTAGDLAISNVIDHKEGYLKELISKAVTKAPTTNTVRSIFMDLYDITSTGDSRNLLRDPNHPTVEAVGTLQGTQVRKQTQNNAALGMLLDIQQFLRDAALKPKQSASVGQAATLFQLQNQKDYAWAKGVTGLSKLLEAAPEDKKSMVLKEFIKTSVGARLNIDFGVPVEDMKSIDSGMAQEMRAFSVLEMMNEYLSGKLSAKQMMTEESSFGGLLSARKEQLREAGQEWTDKEIVQDTLVQSLTRFRSEFIYNSVLEGDTYSQMLGDFAAKMMVGYDVVPSTDISDGKTVYVPFVGAPASDLETRKTIGAGEIDKRVAAFRDSKLQAMNEASGDARVLSADEIGYQAGLAKIAYSKDPLVLDRVRELNTELNEAVKVAKAAKEGQSRELVKVFDERSRQVTEDKNLFMTARSQADWNIDASTNIAAEIVDKKNEVADIDKQVKELKTARNIELGNLNNQMDAELVGKLASYRDKLAGVTGRRRRRSSAATSLAIAVKDKNQLNEYINSLIKTINTTREGQGLDSLSKEKSLAMIATDLISRGVIDEDIHKLRLDIDADNWLHGEAKFKRDGQMYTRKQLVKQEKKNIRKQSSDKSNIEITLEAEFAADKAFKERSVFNTLLNEIFKYGEDSVAYREKRATSPVARLEQALSQAQTTRESLQAEITSLEQQAEEFKNRVAASDTLTLQSFDERQKAIKAEKAVFLQSDEYKSAMSEFMKKHNLKVSVIADRIKREKETLANDVFEAKRAELLQANAGLEDVSQTMPTKSINDQVNAFRQRQIEMQSVIIESINRLDQTQIQDKGEIGKAVFKGVIFHNIKHTMQTLISKDGNLFDKLIEVNKTMARIKSDQGLIGIDEDPTKLEVMNIAFASLMGAGKLNASAISQGALLMHTIAEKLKKDTDGAASMLIGAGLNLDAVEDSIRDAAKQQADGNKREEERRIKEMRKDYVELMTTKFDVDDPSAVGGKRSSSIAEEVIGEAARGAKAKDLQKETEVYKGAYAQAIAEGNNDRASMLGNMINSLAAGADSEFDISLHNLRAVHNKLNRDESKALNELQGRLKGETLKLAQKEHGRGTLLSLFAIPALFAVAQGDVTFNDRVASMFTDVAQTLITSTSFEDSPIRQMLAGKDPESDLGKAAQRAQKTNQLMQRARIMESIRRSPSETEGLIKGAAFEASMQVSGALSSKLASKMFKGNLTAQVATEVLSGMASMAVGSALTNRAVPGTFNTYDAQMALTLKIITNIKNNMLMVESQAMSAAVNGELEMGPESMSIDEVLRAGDFEAPEANTSMSYVERFKFYQNTVDSSEEITILTEGAYV